MRARQGMRAYVHVPRTPFSIAAGLPDLNGREVVLVRRSSVVASRCWVVDPPLCTTFRRAAQDPDGRELLPGHQHQLPALPEAWMTARAPTWSGEDLAFLREHYGTLPTAAIAAQLGRGLAATRSKVEDLHLRCRTVWTPELDEIVTLMFPDTSAPEIGALVGATEAAVRERGVRLGLRKQEGFAAEHSRRTTRARSPFTPEISEVIALMYPDSLAQDLADFIGMTLRAVLAFAKRRGIRKDQAWLRQTARERSSRPDHPMRRHQFQKGIVPPNKGVKGWDSGGRSHETRFKKGQVCTTKLPIGTVRVNSDGYLDRKVAETGYPPKDWKAVHRLVWIEANGPIPKGHVVRFKDGMRTTDVDKITPEILECITLRENALRNAWHANLPPELRKLVGTRIALTRAINKRQRETEETT
jgi:HNH endonuclease